MKMRFEHSQEDVRAIQDSFQRNLDYIYEAISPADLQAANSMKVDVFKLFFEALVERKADLEPHKSYLRGKVPPHYQQDLEQAVMRTGAVAMEELAPSKGKRVPGSSCSMHHVVQYVIRLQ